VLVFSVTMKVFVIIYSVLIIVDMVTSLAEGECKYYIVCSCIKNMDTECW